VKTSTVAGVLVGLLGLTLTPTAAHAADSPTIAADVKVGQVVDFSFPCDYSAPDRWFSDGELIAEPVINALTVRPEDLGHRLIVERTCAKTGETLRTPETGIVTSTGPQVPVIGTLAKPPTGTSFLRVKDTQSSVMGDPTDPGIDLHVGQLGADNQTLIDPSSLTVTVAAVKKGQRVPPLDAGGVRISSTGSVRHVSFAPTEIGNVTLVFTVAGTTGATSTYSLDYYASGATTPTSRVMQMSSDASTAIDAGDGYLFVADDEESAIRLYDADRSGLPVSVVSAGTPTGEDDFESSARTGDSVLWLGSHGNSKKGEIESSRHVVYETTISGNGADATLAPVGKYTGLRKDLIAWDQANNNRYKFAAATAAGNPPDGPNRFNIEGAEFAPDGTTLYLGFRGPLTGGVAGGKALIVPVNNILQLTRGQATKAIFGPPIELDLGGHSIREIRKNAAGEYLILTADAVPFTVPNVAGRDQLLWYWNGAPQTAPEKLTTVVPQDVEKCFETIPAWEGIGSLPDDLRSGAQIRLIEDQGYACAYAPGPGPYQATTYLDASMKDIAADQLRKARTDVVTLTGAMGVKGALTGSGVFPDQRVGVTSPSQTVTVTNTGTKPLPIAKVSVADGDGASAQTFTVDGGACVGRTLAVGATCATQVRFAPVKASAVSAATLKIEGPDGLVVGSLSLTGTAMAVFSTVSEPTISNPSPTVGDTLTATTPAWAPVAELSHQWLRDGQPISGASAASYAVTEADVGHRISVTVTGTATGHVPESRTSAQTQAVAPRVGPPAPTTQHVTKKVKPTVTVKALSKRRMQVTVSAKGVSAAKLTQHITVKIAGAKKAYRVTLVRGKGTIRLTGSSAAKIKNGKKVRVTVLVPRLTTTTAAPSLVTTYEVSTVTARKALTVRR
jgi:hypothetical protein